MKSIYLTFFAFFFAVIPNLSAQTTTVLNGTWSNVNNWSNGLPANNNSVTVFHKMLLDMNIFIGYQKEYHLKNGSEVVQPKGATKNNIHMDSETLLDLEGTFKIEGNLIAGYRSTVHIKANDTLVVGDASFDSEVNIVIEPMGVMIVNGNLQIGYTNTIIIDGNLYVNGNVNTHSSSTISGSGKFEATGKVTLAWQTTVFGSNTSCNAGPCSYGTGSALPVELRSFTGKNSDGKIKLEWITESEVNNDYFAIEKSLDGISFEEVARVNGNGTINSQQRYSVLLPTESLIIYFRLKQVDYNGENRIYKTIAIKPLHNNPSSSYKIYPNPLKKGKELKMHFNNSTEMVKFQIRDLTGRLILDKNLHSLSSSFHLNEEFKAGTYVLTLIDQFETFTEKLIITD